MLYGTNTGEPTIQQAEPNLPPKSKKILDFKSRLYSGLVAVREKDLKRERFEKTNGLSFMIGETVSSLPVAATKHEFHSSNT